MRFTWFSRDEQVRSPASPAHKVIITGPGRSGTTLLMQLLTELGFDTGFSEEDTISEISMAGLEHGLNTAMHKLAPLTPHYIIKSPLICDTLASACQRGNLVVDHIFVPIRDLDSVVASRARVSAIEKGHPGGLDGEDEQQQRLLTTRSLYQLFQTAAHYDLPITLLDFPRLAQDPEYLYRKLQFLLANISFRRFSLAFTKIVRLEYIHTFE